MRAQAAAAERAKEVRDAALGWKRAGLADETVLKEVLARYPDDRHRFGLGFRILAFVFTSIAVWAAIFISFLFVSHDLDEPALFFVWAAILAGATELQLGPWARANAGAESATGLIAVFMAILGGVLIGDPSFSEFKARFLISALAFCGLAAWRWGGGPFFIAATLAGFGLLGQAVQGRFLWIAASLLLIPVCLRAARSPRCPPSHRRGATLVGAVAILALYAAIHVWSWDHGVIEALRLSDLSADLPAPPYRLLAVGATAVLPALFLLAGWRLREPLLLHSGLLLVGASIATIRLYHSVMPLSVALILIGSLCLGLALWVRRWLRGSDVGERDGFTADPLFDHNNRAQVIQSVVAMASFTPAARPAAEPAGFEGGGGSFGGGGASGNF